MDSGLCPLGQHRLSQLKSAILEVWTIGIFLVGQLTNLEKVIMVIITGPLKKVYPSVGKSISISMFIPKEGGAG